MFAIRKNAWVFLLWSTFTATISLFASAVITSMVLSPLDFAIIDTILAGGIGGLFLGIFLMNRHKVPKMSLAGLAAIPIGFWSAFILAGGVDLLLSLIGVNIENPNIYNIENIIGIILMGDNLRWDFWSNHLWAKSYLGVFSSLWNSILSIWDISRLI